jgi:hypothetical protein
MEALSSVMVIGITVATLLSVMTIGITQDSHSGIAILILLSFLRIRLGRLRATLK